jgi:hypothetical protein
MRLSGTARWIRRTVLVALAGAVVLVTAGWIEAKRNADEEYAVYSAYLSDGLLNDAHDWGVDAPVQVVIKDKTGGGQGWIPRTLYVMRGRVHLNGLQTSTRWGYIVRNLFSTRLRSKFRLPRRATIAFASESDYGSAVFQKKFPQNIGLIELSGVGFDLSRTQALFYIDHFCGLCGGGRYVLMEKVDGAWRVRGERYTWIS